MTEYCVTGGTGFIAAYLIKTLLERGYTVRTTVRDPGNEEKFRFLWQMKGARERLKIMGADLMTEGSFDEAIRGAIGVFHTAAPVLVPYDDNVYENLVQPSIKGTLNVLKSCTKATSVRRVVLTSSCSAIRYSSNIDMGSPLNESDWSDPEYCKKNKLWYPYAKTLAEKAAWQIAKESGLDLVVVNPSFIIGPLLAPQPTSTLLLLLGIIKGAIGEYPNQAIGFVHIDDAILTHILAMEESTATGRLICSSTVAHWSDIIHMLKAKYPSYPYETKRGTQIGDDKPHIMDSSKILQLGHPGFKSIAQMFDDCIKSFQDKGFL
ncbi:hypothetical protein vseg_016036 [Gypsophila vaccaria]